MKLSALLFAASYVCMDWHSGQTSRGYRLLGLVLRGCRRRGLNPYALGVRYPLRGGRAVAYRRLERAWQDQL
jgi:hypothetical protein